MKLLTLSISRPRPVNHAGKTIMTGFYNSPVEGRLRVERTNIDGDEQADLTVHGGPDKAVYAFPSEHYGAYESAFGPGPFVHGHFGENLTTCGMSEAEVQIGDRYAIGTAVFEVSQPRSPCFKFGIRMGDRAAIRFCLDSAMTGFYFRVIEEGEVGAGDAITLAGRAEGAPSVEAVHHLYFHDTHNVAGLEHALACAALSEVWKNDFRKRLDAFAGSSD